MTTTNTDTTTDTTTDTATDTTTDTTTDTAAMTTTKTMKYVINGETEIKTIEVEMTNDEIIEARINALKLLVANGTATQEEKDELALLK